MEKSPIKLAEKCKRWSFCLPASVPVDNIAPTLHSAANRSARDTAAVIINSSDNSHTHNVPQTPRLPAHCHGHRPGVTEVCPGIIQPVITSPAEAASVVIGYYLNNSQICGDSVQHFPSRHERLDRNYFILTENDH